MYQFFSRRSFVILAVRQVLRGYFYWKCPFVQNSFFWHGLQKWGVKLDGARRRLAYGENKNHGMCPSEKNIQGDGKKEDAKCYDGRVWAKSGYTGSIKIALQCELIGWMRKSFGQGVDKLKNLYIEKKDLSEFGSDNKQRQFLSFKKDWFVMKMQVWDVEKQLGDLNPSW